MRTHQHNFNAKAALSVLALVVFCLLGAYVVFNVIAQADCSYYETLVVVRKDALRIAERELRDLENSGYLPAVRSSSVSHAISGGIGGALGGMLGGGFGGALAGGVFGYAGGGIYGAVSGGISHYNDLKAAKKKVETAKNDLSDARRDLAACKGN